MSGLTARLEGARLVDVALWAAVALGLLGGLAATVAPVPAVGIAGTLFVTIGLLAAGRRSGQVFLGVLAVVLGIYAFLSRGGAYVGVPPIYIGEVALFIGIVALLLNLGNVRPGIVHVLLLAFMAWGLVRTVPYVVPYGIDALRDGVVWAYGLFALAVAATIRPRDYRTLVDWYRRLVPAFLIAMPVFAVAVRLFDAYIPKWPSSPSQSVG
ncbi:MAG TPA: hypothetical protein VIV06_06875, partial [Candidatus Limnocylindrales bacterium]